MGYPAINLNTSILKNYREKYDVVMKNEILLDEIKELIPHRDPFSIFG